MDVGNKNLPLQAMIQKTHNFPFFSFVVLLTIITISWLAGGCRKDEFNQDTDFKLKFSTDTVLFDTIFTSIGSTTRQFVIRNKSKQKINISSISLAGKEQSPFRINVDGSSGFAFQDIEIGANDSAFVFVKVTIDPNDQTLPFINSDSILFTTNGNKQKVFLVAWGQDAYFYNHITLKGTNTFLADKPHVVYGNLTLDTSAILNISPGAQLCFHQNSYLVAHKDSRIKAEGNRENPIVFRGNMFAVFRPDKDTIPGQWGGLRLKAKVAIDADSCIVENALTLYNSRISNMVNFGLKLKNTNIIAANCEISNCGGYLLSVTGGSEYDFRNCTFANYWPFTARKVSSVQIANFSYYDTKKYIYPLNAVYFGNCIIDSYNGEELEINRDKTATFGLTFEKCLISSDTVGMQANYFVGCEFNKKIKFENVQKLNFQLDTLSAAKDFGALSIIQSAALDLFTDIKGVRRDLDANPDAGAYERKEIR
jgi:hypothetical protein